MLFENPAKNRSINPQAKSFQIFPKLSANINSNATLVTGIYPTSWGRTVNAVKTNKGARDLSRAVRPGQKNYITDTAL